MNEIPFSFSSKFVLPESGIFEFDFVLLNDIKYKEKDAIEEESFQKLIGFLSNEQSNKNKIDIFK